MSLTLTRTCSLPRRFTAVLALVLGVCAALTPLRAQVSREYDVKAAFLYNFVTFTDWPAGTFSTDNSPYVIGVLGTDPFGAVLDEIVSNEQIKGRPLVVRRLARVDDTTRCHILFISTSEARRLKDILQRVRGQPMLTVSDLPGFAQAGGGVAFTAGTRIGLVINPATLRESRLTVSSKLLRLAQLVPEEAR